MTSTKKHNAQQRESNQIDPYLDSAISYDDVDEIDIPTSPPPSGRSSHWQRPMSILSTSTSTNTIASTNSSGSKKGFRLFRKDTKNSTQSDPPLHSPHQHSSQKPLNTVSVYSSDSPAIDFEDLIRSGNTVRVSLTPNRLKSIEITSDHARDDNSDNASFFRRKLNKRSSQRSAKQQQQQQQQMQMQQQVQQQQQQQQPKSPPLSPTPPKTSMEKASLDQPRGPSLEAPSAPFENPRTAPKPPHKNLRTSDPAEHKIRWSDTNDDRRGSPKHSLESLPALNEEDEGVSRPTRRPLKNRVERPSSMVAKRASMNLSNRPTSFHESFAMQENHPNPLLLHQDPGLVRDKVLKFEQPPAQPEQNAASSSRRERMLHLLRQDATTIEQRASVFRPARQVTPVEVGVQTDPIELVPHVVVTSEGKTKKGEGRRPSQFSIRSSASERGVIEGDEEWFVPDEDWEEDEREQEHTLVEWLLGE